MFNGYKSKIASALVTLGATCYLISAGALIYQYGARPTDVLYEVGIALVLYGFALAIWGIAHKLEKMT